MKSAAVAAVLALLVSAVAAAGPARATGAACGAATQASVARDYRQMAWTVYQGELAGLEVREDAAHVRASRALAAGLATGDTAAVLAATHALVFHRHWHIVRLRVLSSTGRVLADIGGPYVLAPVLGHISYRGKTVGSFVMSVQDDAGYAKLVTRFSGLPIEIYAAGQPVEGESFPAGTVPAAPPANGSALALAGANYVALSYAVKAFPSGSDRVFVAVPRVTAGQQASSCFAVDAATSTSIASHLAKHVTLPADAGVFVAVDHEFTPSALVFVVSGSNVLASSSHLALPSRLPLAGQITFLGHQWLVKSFVPWPRLSVYLLYPEPAVG